MKDRGLEILLVGFGGLGDLLVSLPAISYLRRTMPDRTFTLLCRGEYGNLFLESREVNRVISLEGRGGGILFGASADQDPETRRWMSGIDVIAGWMRKPLDPATRSAIDAGCPGRLQIIVPGPGLAIPLSRFFFDRTRDIFPTRAGRTPEFDECARLRVSDQARAEARTVIGPANTGRDRYAVVHPGSGGQAKCWPLSNYLEIIRRLDADGIPGILVTGEAEEKPTIALRLEKESLPGNWTWARRPTLGCLSGLLEGSSFYLGNDSGVTHLAAACGSRVLALFRDEGMPVWKPFGRTRVLSASDPADINMDRVWEELKNFFLRSDSSLI